MEMEDANNSSSTTETIHTSPAPPPPPPPPPSAADGLVSESNLSLVVLMGLPASGKSTFANKLSQFCTEWRSIVLSYDEFVPLNIQAELVISQQKTNYAEVQDEAAKQCIGPAKILRKKFVTCVETVVKILIDKNVTLLQENEPKASSSYFEQLEESLHKLGQTDLIFSDQLLVSKCREIVHSYCTTSAPNLKGNSKTVIIIDDNNYYQSMRNDFYQVAKLSEIGFCIIFCDASLKTCLQRNLERSLERQVPNKAIIEMNVKLEKPNPMINAFDVYCIQITTNDNSEANLKLVEAIVTASFSNPVRQNADRTDEIERERRICSESEVHQADLVLRKWISKKMNLTSFSGLVGKRGSSSRSIDKKVISKELNAKKKATLENLRLGDLRITYEVHQDVEFRNEIITMFENLNLS